MQANLIKVCKSSLSIVLCLVSYFYLPPLPGFAIRCSGEQLLISLHCIKKESNSPTDCCPLHRIWMQLNFYSFNIITTISMQSENLSLVKVYRISLVQWRWCWQRNVVFNSRMHNKANRFAIIRIYNFCRLYCINLLCTERARRSYIPVTTIANTAVKYHNVLTYAFRICFGYQAHPELLFVDCCVLYVGLCGY